MTTGFNLINPGSRGRDLIKGRLWELSSQYELQATCGGIGPSALGTASLETQL